MSKCRHYFPRLVLLPEQEHRLHHLPQYPGLHQGKVGHLPFFNSQPGVSQVAKHYLLYILYPLSLDLLPSSIPRAAPGESRSSSSTFFNNQPDVSQVSKHVPLYLTSVVDRKNSLNLPNSIWIRILNFGPIWIRRK